MTAHPNNLTFGFHGTTELAARNILTVGFRPSVFAGDWLGSATYFWENDEERARSWARAAADRHGDTPVVVRAVLDLTDCFDLTQMRFRRELLGTADILFDSLPASQLAKMRQNFGRRELDAEVINTHLASRSRADGTPRFTSVRGAFQEGSPLYEIAGMSSGIRDLDHVQIGVTDGRAVIEADLRPL